MTLLRIAKDSHSIPKGSQIRGYCPIKRFIPLEIVSDPDKWKELNHMVEELAKKLSGKSIRYTTSFVIARSFFLKILQVSLDHFFHT